MVCCICTRLDPSKILVLYCLNFFFRNNFLFLFIRSKFFMSNINKHLRGEAEEIFVSIEASRTTSIEADFIVQYQKMLFASYSVSMSVGFLRQCLFSFLFNLFDFVLIFILFVLCDLNTTYIYRSMHEHSICFFLGMCFIVF